MQEYTFGANILENLTTGMYQDSKVIYREYIQNACDQIDKAENLGILRPRLENNPYPDLGEGKINIWLDRKERNIIIEDNATGIKASKFQQTLGSIADSDKTMGQDKGFRGIGRLCGLAYCKKLVFTSRWQGEDVISIMTCDAQKMRKMINETNLKVQKYSASDVLNAMTEFHTRPVKEQDKGHFFRVELLEVNPENEDLFGEKSDDSLEKLTNYLSFVAPVPYQANFIYRSEIYKYASEKGLNIDEYDIRVEGEQIFKKYKTHLQTGNGEDHVTNVRFQDFYDGDRFLGWLWFGVTSFKAAIKSSEISRCIRLRKENIQIGDNDTLRDLFQKEATRRGNNYFIGEVHAVSKELIPNSQRSYFNENSIRLEFERGLINYFDNTLYRIYQDGSEINSRIREIQSYQKAESLYVEKIEKGGFLTHEDRAREEKDLADKREKAEKAEKVLEKKKTNNRSILTGEILQKRSSDITSTAFKTAEAKQVSAEKENVEFTDLPKKSKTFLADSMFPQKSKNERKLLSSTLAKIFVIIENSTDKKTSEKIIQRIKEDLR